MVYGYSLEEMSTGSLKNLLLDQYPKSSRKEAQEEEQNDKLKTGCYKYVIIQREKENEETVAHTPYYSSSFTVQAKNYCLDELRVNLTYRITDDIVKHTMRKIEEVEELTFVNLKISDNLLHTIIQSETNLSTIMKLHFKKCTVTASSINLTTFLSECNLQTFEMSDTEIKSAGPIYQWLPSPKCCLIATDVTGEELFPNYMLHKYMDNPVGLLQLEETSTEFTVARIIKLIMQCRKDKRVCTMNFGQIEQSANDFEIITKAQKELGMSWKIEREEEFDNYEIKLPTSTFYFAHPI